MHVCVQAWKSLWSKRKKVGQCQQLRERWPTVVSLCHTPCRCRRAAAGTQSAVTVRSPLKLRPRLDLSQWRWLASFLGACRTSVNRTNSAHLLRLASMSQDVLNRWRVEDHLEVQLETQWKTADLPLRRQLRRGAAQTDRPLQQQVLSAEDCRKLEPSLMEGTFIGGIYNPTEEVADCHAFCQLLGGELRRRDVAALCTGARCNVFMRHLVRSWRWSLKMKSCL